MASIKKGFEKSAKKAFGRASKSAKSTVAKGYKAASSAVTPRAAAAPTPKAKAAAAGGADAVNAEINAAMAALGENAGQGKAIYVNFDAAAPHMLNAYSIMKANPNAREGDLHGAAEWLEGYYAHADGRGSSTSRHWANIKNSHPFDPKDKKVRLRASPYTDLSQLDNKKSEKMSLGGHDGLAGTYPSFIGHSNVTFE